MPSRILVTDNEPKWYNLFQRILEGMGYEVDIAEDSDKATDFLKKSKYDLMLLDVCLKSDVITLDDQLFWEFLKKEYSDLPVIAVTGQRLDAEEVLKLPESINFVDFISKGRINLPDFRRRIQDALNETQNNASVLIEIEGDHFSPTNQRLLQDGLASFLDIPPFAVHITGIQKGSIKVTVEIPEESVEKLIRAFVSRDSELAEKLAPLILLDVRRENEVVQRQSVGDQAYDVFISYSHQDAQWVRSWLLPRLEGAGLRVCIDFRDFQIGVPSLVNMERAVERSRKALLILTPSWLQSEWTNFEVLMLQTQDPVGLRRRMLPLMLEKCKLPSRLSIFTYADFTCSENWEAELPRVFSQIEGEYSRMPGAVSVVSKTTAEGFKLPQILVDFASAPSLQDWEVEGDIDCLTLEYDTALEKRVLVKKGRGFDPAVTYPQLDWRFPHYELAVRLDPESFIYINVLDETGKNRTLLYSSAIVFGLNRWKEFMIPLDKDVSDKNWHSLMIDLPAHMKQAHWPGFVKVNWLRLRGEVVLAGIRGCDDKHSLIEAAIASPYVFRLPAAEVPSSESPGGFAPREIGEDLPVDARALLHAAKSPDDCKDLILSLSEENPNKATAIVKKIGSDLLVSLSDSPQAVRVLFSALEDHSPSVGKLLANMTTPQFDAKMAESPEDWNRTLLILRRLRALEKVYDFFERFVEPDLSTMKPHEDICIFANLISRGVPKSGIFQHPPEHGPSILSYSSILVSDYMKLWLDFCLGILDERPNTGEKQTKFDKPCEGDVVEFGVRINDKRVKLPDSMLNVVGWVHHSLSIKPTGGELTVEFITHARGNTVANWAAWGEPQLLGIRAVQKEVATESQK